jgi:hypothetical protein
VEKRNQGVENGTARSNKSVILRFSVFTAADGEVMVLCLATCKTTRCHNLKGHHLSKKIIFMRFGGLTAVTMKVLPTSHKDMILCSLVLQSSLGYGLLT